MMPLDKLRHLFDGPEKISHEYFEILTNDFLTRHHHPLAEAEKDKAKLNPSAVLVPICYSNNEVKILLTKRLDNLKDHAGQISFPGGKIEKNDMSPIETALREANEEVGLRSDDVNVLGNLDVYITGTGFRIMPIVSIVSDYSYLKANQNEVDEIFFLPLEFLMDSNNHKKESATYEVNNKKYEYDYYVLPYKDYNIWGATAGMLINLYQILK